MTIEKKIADSYFLRGLSHDELLKVCSISTEEKFAKDDTIIAKGCLAQDIYVVTDGWININFEGRRKEDGRAPSTKLMIGGVIGEYSLVSGKSRAATVVAAKDVAVVKINAKKLNALFEKEPGIGYIIMRNIAAKLLNA